MEPPIDNAVSRFIEHRSWRFYFAGSLAISVVGFFADWFAPNDWFSRSGAIIVGLAAFANFLDPRRSGQWWKRLQDDAKSRGAAAQSKAQLNGQDGIGAYHEAITDFANDAKKAQRVSASQATAVLYGTVVWGFGDLIFNQGCAPC
ncbi:hypothetical protein [Roseovarius aestuariivivens]|uniref:hypothetical protein n=1 Tax=Roseovarius aestuariivivens TaxID=1888910 RepID=UPI0010804911|nr:hypothetical protein [Roseovarius aestuariivivens]